MDRRSFLKGPVTLVQGVVKQGRQPPIPKPIVTEEASFLDSLDKLLEKHVETLAKKLGEEIATTLEAKIKTLPLANISSRDIMERSSSNLPRIDESIFVTEEKIDGIQKGYEEIVETQVEQDNTAEKALNKLRSLKKG